MGYLPMPSPATHPPHPPTPHPHPHPPPPRHPPPPTHPIPNPPPSLGLIDWRNVTHSPPPPLERGDLPRAGLSREFVRPDCGCLGPPKHRELLP